MTHRTATWLAWSLWAVCMLLEVVGLALLAIVDPSRLPEQLLVAPAVIGFPTVGALIASRHPDNAIGWLYCITPLLTLFGLFAEQYFVYAVVVSPDRLPAAVSIGWLGNWVGTIGWVTVWTFTLLLFPTGRLPSPRWRPFAWTAGALLTLFTVTQAINPGPLNERAPEVSNPFGVASLGGLIAEFEAADWVFLLLVCGCAASVVARFRMANVVERQQLKWFAYAASIALIAVVSMNVLESPPDWVPVLVADALLGLALAAIPAAVGVAILRHRLYDIDILINRTLVYGLLTGVLAAIYFGSVVLLQASFRAGVGQESDLASVASTLAVAGLFLPMRQRIQAFIDRRFYRSKYDAAATLAAYVATLRDEVASNQVDADLMGVLQATLQPSHAALWVRRDGATNARREEGT